MTSIAELLDRVSRAEGPDWNLDGDLHVTLAGSEPTRDRKAPRYTSSVDSALALLERKLPGCGWYVARGVKDGVPAVAAALFLTLAATEPIAKAEGVTPEIAILAALLSALSNEVNHDAR